MHKALAVGAVMVALSIGGRAYADRMPIPDSKVCNHLKRDAKVARASWDTYMDWMSYGWTVIKPGKCEVMNADALFIAGKHRATGFSKQTEKACVSSAAKFRISKAKPGGSLPAACKKKKGRMVDFKLVKFGKKAPVIDIHPK